MDRKKPAVNKVSVHVDQYRSNEGTALTLGPARIEQGPKEGTDIAHEDPENPFRAGSGLLEVILLLLLGRNLGGMAIPWSAMPRSTSTPPPSCASLRTATPTSWRSMTWPGISASIPPISRAFGKEPGNMKDIGVEAKVELGRCFLDLSEMEGSGETGR